MIHSLFQPEPSPKVGIGKWSKNFDISGRKIKTFLWESLLSGDEIDNDIKTGAQGALFIFDFNNAESFQQLSKKCGSTNCTVGAVLGILCDDQSEVQLSEVKSFATNHKFIYTDVTPSSEGIQKIEKIATILSRALKDTHETQIARSIPKLSELHRLVRENDIERAILCIYKESNLRKAARDLNIQDHRGMTPLHVAGSIGNFAFTSFLIKSGANVNARDKDLQTPLHVAAGMGYDEIVIYLLVHGAKPDARDKSHLTYLGVAAREGNLSIIRLAIESGADTSDIRDLDLSGKHLKDLPDFPWEKLDSLRNLDLEGNSLEFLPTSLCRLPQLERVVTEGNPLRAVPPKYRSQWPNLRDYMKTLIPRKSQWNEMKIMLVGQEGVGKTTLLKTLRSKKHRVNCKENLSTDGINMQSNLSFDESNINFTAWDFGGQEVYYPSHQFFLSNHSIYLIVFNVCDIQLSRIDYWMNQLKSLNKEDKSPIFLVGTHVDDPRFTESNVEQIISLFKGRYPKHRYRSFVDVILVSCRTGHGIRTLIEKILSTAVSFLPTLESESWINFFEFLKNQLNSKEKKNYITWNGYANWAKRCGITPHELYHCTRFLIDVGSILYFPEDKELSNIVILNPQFLADIMSNVITFRHNWIKKGILKADDIPQLFIQYDSHIIETMLYILTKFFIIYKVKDSENYLVPYVLPEEPPNSYKLWEHKNPKVGEILITDPEVSSSQAGWSKGEKGWVRAEQEIRRIYCFSFIPNGFFGRTMVRILYIMNVKCIDIWRYGVIIENSNNQRAAITYNPISGRIQISIRCPRDSVSTLLMFQLVEVIEGLVNKFYPKLRDGLRRLVACSHCILIGKPNPFEFPLSECITAITMNTPFIFCNNLTCPSRCVRVDIAAPDIALIDYPLINSEDLTIDKSIGSGGFGIVYKGLYEGKQVAIKELKFILGTSTEMEEKFREFRLETWIMTHLKHPNLVLLTGITVAPLRIIMEYIDQGDLFHFIHPKYMETENDQFSYLHSISPESFPYPIRNRIAFDIARGMRYLQHGISPPIIHRDLRSPNIFIVNMDPTAEVCAKVADFGLARLASSDLDGTLGSWQWLAPEVFDQNTFYDQRADVYSYGIILWEIYTLSIPFTEYLRSEEFTMTAWDGAGKEIKIFKDQEIQQAIINNNLRPTIPPTVPLEIANIIKRCWEKDPNDRPTFIEIVSLISKFSGIQAKDLDDDYFDLFSTSNILKLKPRDMGDSKFIPISRKISAPSQVRCMVNYRNSVWMGHLDGKITIWNYHSYTILHTIHTSICNHLVIVSDSEIWGAFEDGYIRCWDPKYRLIGEWIAHPFNPVKSLIVTYPRMNTSNSEENIILGDEEIRKENIDVVITDLKVDESHSRKPIPITSVLKEGMGTIRELAFGIPKREKFDDEGAKVWSIAPSEKSVKVWNATTKSLNMVVTTSNNSGGSGSSSSSGSSSGHHHYHHAGIKQAGNLTAREHHRENHRQFDTLPKGFSPKSMSLFGHTINCITKHGDWVWVGGNGELFCYSAFTFQLRGSWRAHDSSVSAIVSTGDWLVTGAATGEMKVWEDRGGEDLLLVQSMNLHCAKILNFALNPLVNGQLWSCSLDKTIIIWDYLDGFNALNEIVQRDIVTAIAPCHYSMWVSAKKNILVYSNVHEKTFSLQRKIGDHSSKPQHHLEHRESPPTPKLQERGEEDDDGDDNDDPTQKMRKFKRMSKSSPNIKQALTSDFKMSKPIAFHKQHKKINIGTHDNNNDNTSSFNNNNNNNCNINNDDDDDGKSETKIVNNTFIKINAEIEVSPPPNQNIDLSLKAILNSEDNIEGVDPTYQEDSHELSSSSGMNLRQLQRVLTIISKEMETSNRIDYDKIDGDNGLQKLPQTPPPTRNNNNNDNNNNNHNISESGIISSLHRSNSGDSKVATSNNTNVNNNTEKNNVMSSVMNDDKVQNSPTRKRRQIMIGTFRAT